MATRRTKAQIAADHIKREEQNLLGLLTRPISCS